MMGDALRRVQAVRPWVAPNAAFTGMRPLLLLALLSVPCQGAVRVKGPCVTQHMGLHSVAQTEASPCLRAAMLETQEFRLAAITTYARLGFRARPRDEAERSRWRAVQQRLPGAVVL